MSEEFVMSKGKDPFNILKGRERNAEWVQTYFNQYIVPHMEAEKIPAIHIRDIHYTLQGKGLIRPNGKPYLNDEQSWDFMVNSMRDARLLQLVPYEKIRDNKNKFVDQIKFRDHEDINMNIENAAGRLSYEGLIDSAKAQFINMFCKSLYQDYYVEFWTEKTLPILEQVSQKYAIMSNLVEGEGEISLTQINDLCKRALEYKRPVRIGYLGDFDVVGLNLARSFSRKLEYFVRTYSEYEDLEIKVQRLMILPDQVRDFDLPLKPMKVGKKQAYETRKEKFYEQYGLVGAVELNTLHVDHSQYFRQTLENFVRQYYDHTPYESVRRMEKSIMDKVDSLIRENIEEFEIAELDWSDIKDLYDPDSIVYSKDIEENDEDWLYDSTRSPEEQKPFYENI